MCFLTASLNSFLNLPRRSEPFFIAYFSSSARFCCLSFTEATGPLRWRISTSFIARRSASELPDVFARMSLLSMAAVEPSVLGFLRRASITRLKFCVLPFPVLRAAARTFAKSSFLREFDGLRNIAFT